MSKWTRKEITLSSWLLMPLSTKPEKQSAVASCSYCLSLRQYEPPSKSLRSVCVCFKANNDEGIYNTYVLDSDYTSWALLLHCAEKSKEPRYLSSFIMSREPILAINVKAYLRDKLPQYGIDLAYLFDMSQENCDVTSSDLDMPPAVLLNRIPPQTRRHPMKNHHKF